MSLTSIQYSIEELRRFPRQHWLELARSDQSHRWRQGIRILAEDYFLHLPEIRGDAEEALVLITGELLLRREVGETLDIGEYQTRFPEFADRIAVQFCVDDFLSSTDGASAQAASDDVRNLELPGYEFLEEIGRGAVGVVYKARQESLDRFVAIKVVAIPGADAKQLARQRQEAEILARLHHPNVVHIYEVRDHRGCLHLVMEYVDGTTLAARVRGTLPAPGESARMALTLADTVQAVHEAGVLHRDLKPSNVLQSAAGELKISDFGLAKLRANSSLLTTTDCVLGTPSYMAPEQAVGDAQSTGPEADVYSLGAILYELLTGRAPFLGATVLDTLSLIRSHDPVAPRHLQPNVPRDLETICLKCLAKSPKHRYAAAADLADDLERFLSDQPIIARRSSQFDRAVRWCRSNPLNAGLAGAVAALLVAAVATLAVSNSRIRGESTARAVALQQKDAALATAREAVDQMLSQVASSKFSNVPLGHPLRLSLLTDALAFYESLRQLDEADRSLIPEMADVLHAMAVLQHELGQGEEGLRSIRQGIDLLVSLEDSTSPSIGERIANMELTRAYTLDKAAESAGVKDPAVEAQFRQALDRFRDLEQRWPEKHYPYVLCLRFLGERAYQRGDLQEAEQLWHEAIANGEACLSQRPEDLDTRVSVCWACMQLFNRILGPAADRSSDAETILKKGLTHVNIALQQQPRSAQARDVAATLRFGLALNHCRSERIDEAIASFQEASENIQSLCAEFPWTSDYWNTLQWFIDDTVSNLEQQRRPDAAQDALRGFATWMKVVSLEIPQEPGPRKLLEQSRIHLVKALVAANLNDEADELSKLNH